eukprot:3061299-Prorocentrum_lima.AAC.1
MMMIPTSDLHLFFFLFPLSLQNCRVVATVCLTDKIRQVVCPAWMLTRQVALSSGLQAELGYGP